FLNRGSLVRFQSGVPHWKGRGVRVLFGGAGVHRHGQPDQEGIRFPVGEGQPPLHERAVRSHLLEQIPPIRERTRKIQVEGLVREFEGSQAEVPGVLAHGLVGQLERPDGFTEHVREDLLPDVRLATTATGAVVVDEFPLLDLRGDGPSAVPACQAAVEETDLGEEETRMDVDVVFASFQSS
ncbi:MAG: hypothetical protein JXB39_14520, partial [Deltaproteobacteria bacterium]|nr:hypothetical protein [Deltaproteobacteria bacterium]